MPGRHHFSQEGPHRTGRRRVRQPSYADEATAVAERASHSECEGRVGKVKQAKPARLSLVIAAILVLTVLAATAQGARHPGYQFTRLGSGFTGALYVTSAPGDHSTLYIVEQRGTIEIVRDGNRVGTFLDIHSEVLDDGEHGLLGLAFSPNYAQNHLFYVDYSDLNGDTHVSQLTSENGVGLPASEHRLLYVQQPFPNHKGGMLAFDNRGRLYVGMGDGGTDPTARFGDQANRAQNINVMLGKLLRIDAGTAGATWQIAALGLRNPWRFSFDRQTGDLWLADVGTHLYEEIDFRAARQLDTLANFGWSRFEGTIVYNPAIGISTGTLVRPFYEYTWGINHKCGIIGGYVYRGTRVPKARGRYFFGDLCSGSIWSLKRDPKGRATPAVRTPSVVPQLTSFGEDGNGELYAVSLSGSLYRLVRAR
jgi:glucose/arabinose dehydrogenase